VSPRTGLTTGACAAAAAKAAAMLLSGGDPPGEVALRLPSGDEVRVPILAARREGPDAATASVRKDAGDDPDVTNGLEIHVRASWTDAADLVFVAGEGVGTITKPGLQLAPGEPAINPMPRRMIAAAIREVTSRSVRIEISIPGGREIAARTFNPRLGIQGGLSILGTTGIVRPYCLRAFRDALKCALDVAAACKVTKPVLVPGNIGARAAFLHFSLAEEQVIEVGNEWGFALDLLCRHEFQAVLVLGHPGKLAKLAAGEWDTHSSRSHQATEYLNRLCVEVLGRSAPDRTTTEGMFQAMPDSERGHLANALADRVHSAVAVRLANRLPVGVVLVNMAGVCLGRSGDLSLWR
jgi:cobalt-precorrin-5B (C1)-methyltransferase